MDTVAMNPCFHVDENQIKEIKNWEVGETYQMVVDVVMTSKREEQNSLVTAELDVVAYKYLPRKKIEEMTDAEFGEY